MRLGPVLAIIFPLFGLCNADLPRGPKYLRVHGRDPRFYGVHTCDVEGKYSVMPPDTRLVREDGLPNRKRRLTARLKEDCDVFSATVEEVTECKRWWRKNVNIF